MKWECLTLAFVTTMLGCRKPYNPPAVSGINGYLVVEGVINPGSDSTIITLSRTVNISSNITINPVSGAVLTVISDQNTSYPLTDAGGGNYISAGLNLDVAHQYRLNIQTSDGKKYQSDFEAVTITPPIDSIGFNITTTPVNGVQVYVNTHDPTNNIKYYRWDYSENWEFHSLYTSNFISNGTKLVERTPSQYVSDCYSGDISSDIVLGSSAKLSQATVYQNPLVFIPSTSEKVETRYSVSVHQYALTSDAYSFWINLKKNTEQLGSIFDAQPSETPGNLHCITNPSEPVAGYVSICTVASKIQFIYGYQLPAWVPAYPYVCSLDTPTMVGSYNWKNLVDYPDLYLPIDGVGPVSNPTAFSWTTRPCADCSIRGSLTPPSFWK